MSNKINAIRKKVLECVRTQDWPSAIKEYKRLTELDQSNPNVFNELGDIYLKTGNKTDAYDSFICAIDGYTRVSLHNNAVAVCKKVLRLIPARFEILIKLGIIRKKQGLAKEAESYYVSFLDKILVDQQLGPEEVKKAFEEIEAEMADSTAVLEKLYESKIELKQKDDTAGILQKLYALYQTAGNAAGAEETRERLEQIGAEVVEPAPASNRIQDDDAIITEENIWSVEHTEGERITVDRGNFEPVSASGEQTVEQGAVQGTEQSAEQGTDVSTGGSIYEHGDVATEAAQAGQTSRSDAGFSPEPSGDIATQTIQAPHETPAEEAPQPDVTPDPYTVAGQQPDLPPPPAKPEEPAETVIGDEQPISFEDEMTKAGVTPGESQNITISAVLGDGGEENDSEATEEDYRSHYDLGMAYIEMDLLSEAIREYQFASKSPQFRARALEMIGLCFLKQNQARLAIKQLTKGLQHIDETAEETLGIKYNLGLAYEMTGDNEKAKNAFEDVYVEDVTFRDVAEKIEKYK